MVFKIRGSGVADIKFLPHLSDISVSFVIKKRSTPLTAWENTHKNFIHIKISAQSLKAEIGLPLFECVCTSMTVNMFISVLGMIFVEVNYSLISTCNIDVFCLNTHFPSNEPFFCKKANSVFNVISLLLLWSNMYMVSVDHCVDLCHTDAITKIFIILFTA